MFATRATTTILHQRRLDTDFYDPDAIQALEAIQAFQPVALAVAGTVWNFGAYELCNEIRNSDDPDAPVFITITDIDEPFVDISQCMRVTDETHRLLQTAAVELGDIIVSIAGTIGSCGIIPRHQQRGATANQAIAKFRVENSDRHFVLAYFMSRHFKRVMAREAGGAVQKNLYLHNFSQLPLIKIHGSAEAYIGNKVRQAERLRERASALQSSINILVSVDAVEQALQSADSRTTRPAAAELDSRLDAKFYGLRAMRVLRACQNSGGVALAELNPNVSNGFELRDFVTNGVPYVTVGDVATGRLDLTSCPHIPSSAEVPNKAKLDVRCVLVVRSGSIGAAAKVHEEDTHACISSHLIRLRFSTEAVAAAVAAFLNSRPGTMLQGKIIYGGVQPQISQEELLAIPIPRRVLDNGDDVLELLNCREAAIRNAQRLTTAAKLLVEALIDGKVTEADLIAAHSDVNEDRRILQRLTPKGLDVQGEPPLFPDLDALQQALADASGT